jgi:photosystem II stability/assembly factor-like uncharacterized protein
MRLMPGGIVRHLLVLPAAVVVLLAAGLLADARPAHAAKWVEVNAQRPLPRGSIGEMAFVDARRGWVGGVFLHAASGEMRAAIAHTPNAGRTWRIQHWLTPRDVLGDVFMLDAKTGWAVAGAAILHTRNGKTWREQYRFTPRDRTLPYAPDDPLALHLTSIAFAADGRTGVAVGYVLLGEYLEWIVLRSEDGGTHWQWQTPLAFGGGSGPVVFAGERIYSLASMYVDLVWSRYISRSDDAGLTWTKIYGTKGPHADYIDGLLHDMVVLDADHVVACGNAWPPGYDYCDAGSGLLVRSSDGGHSWSEALYPGQLFDVITFAGKKRGWIAGEVEIAPWTWRSAIFRSRDGGESWKVQYRSRTVRVNDVQAISRRTVWAAGENTATGRPVLLKLKP